MNVSLAKWDGDRVWDMPPLHWTTRGSEVWVSCTNGHAAKITGPDRWSISAEGKVTPSIHCLTTIGPDHDRPCGWHVFATLDDWRDL